MMWPGPGSTVVLGRGRHEPLAATGGSGWDAVSSRTMTIGDSVFFFRA